MELSDLQVFLAVSRAGAITKAASELRTVQSNVSARIASLERELGVRVFRRHARGVVLTAAGEQLLPYAREIARLTEEARRALSDGGAPAGPLRIGSLETTAGLRLPTVLARFTAECPDVDLSLVTGPTEQLVKDVLDYRLDGAMVTGPVQRPELHEILVFTERLVLVTARWVTDLDDVLSGPSGPRLLVFRAGCSYRRRLESLVAARGVAPSRCLEYGTLEGILGCVGAGLGITLMPTEVVEHHLAKGTVRAHELPEREAHAETVFVRRADTVPTAALVRFVEHARGAAPPLQVVTGTEG
jgi:DNA-binding transcriptional LysR family regulator